ncbi:hypothetical protein MHUMG1_06937 [Metarhizium humberi]|uniref:Hydroxynaphthalene reductase-like protein Arp2 n=1 Tax=Metarhizium humberi TaxID=2596975 RepID=A0A9P8S6D2_9HYPO|nr:hypothetical protein MHUMG1_06937 [Metarhizium humberi]
MTTHSLQPVDNAVPGRLALVTGATLAISFLPVHAPEEKHPDTNLPCNTNSGGIGSACAKALAAEGCDVVLHYSSSQEKADTLVNELQRLHPKQLFSTARADLSSREATRLLVPDVLSNPAISARHKAISILVANAGTGRRIRDIKDIEEDDWDLTLEINARSQFVVTKACLPGMRGQGWGRVILVGSIASRGGGINGCHYAASKGAMTSMGLNLATILAPEGVTVNIVSFPRRLPHAACVEAHSIQVQPAMIGATGMIPTPKATTWQSNTDPEELRSTDPGLAIASSVPVHRLGAPEEVANIVVFGSQSLRSYTVGLYISGAEFASTRHGSAMEMQIVYGEGYNTFVL